MAIEREDFLRIATDAWREAQQDGVSRLVILDGDRICSILLSTKLVYGQIVLRLVTPFQNCSEGESLHVF